MVSSSWIIASFRYL